MAKLIDTSKARRITTPEGDWYDIMAACKQEDINAVLAVNLKLTAAKQRIKELQAVISEGGPVPADEITNVLDETLSIQRDLIGRFLLEWSHDADLNTEHIANIESRDIKLIVAGIGETVQAMRGVQADPKKEKPSDASLTPLSPSPENQAAGQ